MNLPADLFDELIGVGRFRMEARQDNRRGAARVPISMRAALVPVAAGRYGPAEPTKLREVSLSGVGLTHPRAFQRGDGFVLLLKTSKGAALWVQCEAVRTQGVATAVFHVGAKFMRLMDVPAARPAPPPPPGAAVCPAPPASPAAAPVAESAPAASATGTTRGETATTAEIDRIRRAICA